MTRAAIDFALIVLAVVVAIIVVELVARWV
jgi:hypothetical protein